MLFVRWVGRFDMSTRRRMWSFSAPWRSWMLLLRNARHSHLWPTWRWTKKEAWCRTSAAKLMRMSLTWESSQTRKSSNQFSWILPASSREKTSHFEICSRGWAQLYPEGDPSRKLLEEVHCSAFPSSMLLLHTLLIYSLIRCDIYATKNDLWLVFEVFPSRLLIHDFWKESDEVDSFRV